MLTALAFCSSTSRAQHLQLSISNIEAIELGPSKSLLKESDLAESGSYFADLFALFLSFTQLTTKINGDCHLKKNLFGREYLVHLTF